MAETQCLADDLHAHGCGACFPLILLTISQMYLICPWEAGNHVSIAGNLHTADWYVFGPAAGFGGSRDGVFIPQAGQGAVHSVHAATVVMFHRYWTLN